LPPAASLGVGVVFGEDGCGDPGVPSGDRVFPAVGGWLAADKFEVVVAGQVVGLREVAV